MSKQFPTLARARAHQATVEADMLRGSYVDPMRGKQTLGEYALEWMSVQTFGPTTRERREQAIRIHIVPKLGHHSLSTLRPSTIQAWVRELTDQLAPRTVREHFRLLSSILSSAVDDERIVKNPCRSSSIRLPRPDERRVVPWTIAQVNALRHELPDRYRPLLTCATGLGLRQGEIFGLAVDDIDFLRRTVTVRRQVVILGSRQVFSLPKGRKSRVVPLPSSVAAELAAYLTQFPARTATLPMGTWEGPAVSASLLVTSREGKALNRNYVNSHVWKPALRRAGLPDTREFMMHGGRHLFASLQLEYGVGPRALADYLGHADPAFMMKVYAHLMPEASIKAGAAVDAMFAGLDDSDAARGVARSAAT
jgi:integrase